jgi:RIO-like serine/threonine protein kinase
MTKDRNLEIARLQKEIGDYIGMGKDSLVYNFETKGKRTELHVITVNPRHNQSFLFHAATGSDKVDALREMLEYVKTYKERTSSYTIQWSTRGDNGLQTSYFRAKNVLEALDKLFYDRDPNSITVFSVMLNPIT